MLKRKKSVKHFGQMTGQTYLVVLLFLFWVNGAVLDYSLSGASYVATDQMAVPCEVLFPILHVVEDEVLLVNLGG